MKPGGLHPRGVQPEWSSRPVAYPGEVQPAPPALEGLHRGSSAATTSGQAKLPCRLLATGLATHGAAGEISFYRRNRDTLQVYCSPRTQRIPKPLWPLWKSARRQEPVPGETSLAPAGGGGAGGSRLLRTVLSDSWSRREDWQGRDVIVDGKGGGGGRRRRTGGRTREVADLRQQLQWGGGGGDTAHPPANAAVRKATPNFPHPQKMPSPKETQRGHHGNNNLFK